VNVVCCENTSPVHLMEGKPDNPGRNKKVFGSNG
jgi:hypothetical protein